MDSIKLDLFPLIRKLEAALKKGISRDMLTGGYRAVFKGKGLEFVGFREYTNDDDAMLIDWKASLRAHKPMVKTFQEERKLTIFFMLDVSNSMLFSSHPKLKCEYAAELVGTLMSAIGETGDSVGLAMFTDKVVKFIPPGAGASQFYQVVLALSDPANYGGEFDIYKAMYYIMNLGALVKDSIVFVVSDFIGLSPGWQTPFQLAGLKYDFTAIVVRDPTDNKLPDEKGEINLGDPFSSNAMIINPSVTKMKYEDEAKKQINLLKQELNKTNSGVIQLETNEEFTGPILRFFKMRQAAQ